MTQSTVLRSRLFALDGNKPAISGGPSHLFKKERKEQERPQKRFLRAEHARHSPSADVPDSIAQPHDAAAMAEGAGDEACRRPALTPCRIHPHSQAPPRVTLSFLTLQYRSCSTVKIDSVPNRRQAEGKAGQGKAGM
ncbi:hypothetical protein ACOMHN_025189 [Nucella lapillus]